MNRAIKVIDLAWRFSGRFASGEVVGFCIERYTHMQSKIEGLTVYFLQLLKVFYFPFFTIYEL
jgi:hypothetical protein